MEDKFSVLEACHYCGLDVCRSRRTGRATFLVKASKLDAHPRSRRGGAIPTVAPTAPDAPGMAGRLAYLVGNMSDPNCDRGLFGRGRRSANCPVAHFIVQRSLCTRACQGLTESRSTATSSEHWMAMSRNRSGGHVCLVGAGRGGRSDWSPQCPWRKLRFACGTAGRRWGQTAERWP